MKFGGQPTPWSEVEVEGLRLRSVSQILIQEIGAAGPENAEDSARRACGVIQRQADQIVSADTRIAELEATLKRQAAAVRMIDMSHVARAETMMQHAQVLHDQSNTAALESERQANAMLTERIAELESSITVRDTEIARLETDLELARIGAERYRWLRDQGGRDVDTPWVVFRGGTWFLRAELDAAIDAARGAG